MKLTSIRLVLATASLALASCGGGAPDASRIGVFADADAVTELNSYFTAGADVFGLSIYSGPGADQFPEASAVSGFYVNMPDAIVSESKLAWMAAFPEPGDFFGQKVTMLGDAQLTFFDKQIVKVGDGVYRITSPALQSQTAGVVAIKVVMPLGTQDRLYCVRLK